MSGEDKLYHCRKVSAEVIDAFIAALEDGAHDGHVSMDYIHKLADIFLRDNNPIEGRIVSIREECETDYHRVQLEDMRKEVLGRVIVRTFSFMLDYASSGISRSQLPQFFLAIKMIVGVDMYEALEADCREIIAAYPKINGRVPWDDFYNDERILYILEQVQVSVARSFKKFEARMDWFLLVMNSSCDDISISSNVFLGNVGPIKKEKRGQFGRAHLFRILKAFFSNRHPANMKEEERAGFQERWGVSVDKIFAPIFVELSKSSE